LRAVVENGGGEERRAWKKLKTRGLATLVRVRMPKGIMALRRRMRSRGLVKMNLNQSEGLRILARRDKIEASIAAPVGEKRELEFEFEFEFQFETTRGLGLRGVSGKLTAEEVG
jgi:hypothetical protein